MEELLSLVARHGYVIVFFGVMLESAGLPLPGETVLLVAGVLAHRGVIDLGDAVFFGILGAVVGDQIGYWIGRKGGRPFVLRWGRYVLITPERLRHAEDFFAAHGGKAVFLARFFAGLRVFGALVAGISGMPWRTFAFFNVLGGAVWATAVVLAGYLLSGSIGAVEHWLGRASLLALVLVVLVFFLYCSYRRYFSPRGEGHAEEERSGVRHARKALKVAVILVLVVLISAVLVGVYLGEWESVWSLVESVAPLIELL